LLWRRSCEPPLSIITTSHPTRWSRPTRWCHPTHQAGDSALVRIGAHLQASFADSAVICRLGGDEFLVVSDEPTITLRRQARDFRKLVVSDPHHEAYRKMRFGVSCGIASVPADAKSIDQAMKLADERMYAVKVRFKKWAGSNQLAR
jgi:diguanylate cyclase (GGDEF)-like protein